MAHEDGTRPRQGQVEELERLRAQYRLINRVVSLAGVAVSIASLAIPLAALLAIVDRVGTRQVEVSGSFYIVSVAAFALTVLAISAQRLRLYRTELQRLRGRTAALEDELAGRPSRTPTGTEEPDEGAPRSGGEPPAREQVGWTPATVALLLVAGITGLFGVFNTILGRSEPAVDCIAYNRRLHELRDQYTAAELTRAFEVFSFGDAERECGRASTYVSRLPARVPVAVTTTTSPARATGP